MTPSCASFDIFTLIIPHLSFNDVVRSSSVCKDWKNAPRHVVLKHVLPVHFFQAQIPVLSRIKVEGMKIFSRRDANSLILLYNEHFEHLKILQLWVEEESVIKLSTLNFHRPREIELLRQVSERAEHLVHTMASGPSFKSLLQLEIGNLVLSSAGCITFARVLLSMPQLEKLQFSYLAFTEENDQPVWDAVYSMDELKWLRVVTVRGQTAFNRVPKNLKVFDVHNMGLTGDNALATMRSLPVHSIETVMVHGFWNNMRFVEANPFSYERMRFSHLVNMQTLQLQNVDMSPSDLHILLQNLPVTLKRLIIACNFLGGSGLSRAFEDNITLPPSLTMLDLSSNFLTARDIRCGVVPHCMHGIETLILDGNDEMFGSIQPSPVHTMVFCDIVHDCAEMGELKFISCRGCGWDNINPATRRPMYPELLVMKADVSVWNRV